MDPSFVIYRDPEDTSRGSSPEPELLDAPSLDAQPRAALEQLGALDQLEVPEQREASELLETPLLSDVEAVFADKENVTPKGRPVVHTRCMAGARVPLGVLRGEPVRSPGVGSPRGGSPGVEKRRAGAFVRRERVSGAVKSRNARAIMMR